MFGVVRCALGWDGATAEVVFESDVRRDNAGMAQPANPIAATASIERIVWYSRMMEKSWNEFVGLAEHWLRHNR